MKMIRQIKGLAVATTVFALSVPAVMAADFPVNGWETIAPKQAARSQEALKALDDYAFDDPIMNEEAGTPIVRTDGLVVIKDGKLEARAVSILARDGDHIIASGELIDGDEVMTTHIAEISEGLRVSSQSTKKP